MSGVNAQTSQISKTYSGNINKGVKLVMNDANNNNEILSLTTPKAAKYMYLSYKNSFTVSLDGTQLTLSDPNQNQQGSQPTNSNNDQKSDGNDDSDGDNDGDDDDDDDEPSVYKTKGYFIKNLDIIFMLGLIILF
jgi:hypothetical protein